MINELIKTTFFGNFDQRPLLHRIRNQKLVFRVLQIFKFTKIVLKEEVFSPVMEKTLMKQVIAETQSVLIDSSTM